MSMKRVSVQGHTLNHRTADMLARAEARLGFDLQVLQGSYNAGGVSASAGTHDGGGAVDVAPTNNPEEVVRQLRESGFAAWHRLPSQGPWGEHIHAIAIGDSELSSGAAVQVTEYYNGQNGLANHAPDDGPRVKIHVWPIKLGAISLARAANQFQAKSPRKTPAVEKIQKLLNYRTNSGLSVDGMAGPKTRQAYKAWEKRVNAPDSDGVPGFQSLSKLVAGYFRLVK